MHYTGPQHRRAILDAMASRIPSLALEANASWLTERGLRAAVLLAKTSVAPPVWAALSCNLSKSNVRVGIASDPATISAFGVTDLPTIVVLKGGRLTNYAGEIAFADIWRALVDEFPELAKTSIVTPLTTASEFDENCRGKGIYCVLQGGDLSTSEFDNIANKNEDESEDINGANPTYNPFLCEGRKK
jgi:hypothetical protein